MIRAEKSIRQGPCESGTNDQGRVENAIYLRKILNFEPKINGRLDDYIYKLDFSSTKLTRDYFRDLPK